MKRILFLSIVVGALAACVGTKGPPLESHTYALEYPSPQPEAEKRRLSCLLRVDAFDAHPFFINDRMVYRKEPFQMDRYRYHRWQAPPAQMVAWHLENDLKRAAFCRAVIDSDSLLPATHVLEGKVEDFFEDDTEHGWQAVLTLSLTLSAGRAENADPQILMQRTYRVRKDCRAKNPLAVAEAMSLAMSEISETALKDLYRHLAEYR